MAGGGRGSTSTRSNPPKVRKQVDASSGSEATGQTNSLVRAKDGSAFAKCEECSKDVPVALISFHSCSLDAKIKMDLKAQVVEKPAEIKKPAEKKKAKSTQSKSKRPRLEKKGTKSKDKDPNMPKRPPTGFFLFMDDFRKEYKEAHPDKKDVKAVAKEGGERWKSMTEEEKKHYMDKVAALKAEYEKAMEAYNAQDQDVGSEGEGGSDKEAPDNEVEEISDGE